MTHKSEILTPKGIYYLRLCNISASSVVEPDLLLVFVLFRGRTGLMCRCISILENKVDVDWAFAISSQCVRPICIGSDERSIVKHFLLY